MTQPSGQPSIEQPRMGRELVILPALGRRDARHTLRNLGIAGACLVLAAGLGWGAGAHLGAATPAAPKVATLDKADVAQLVGQSEATQRQETRQLAAEVRAVKAGLAGLQTSLERGRPVDDVKALKASIEALKQGLDAAKSDTAGALSQLSGKLDRADQGTTQKLAQIAERLDRLERKPDPMPVGSIVPQPPVRPSSVPPLPLPSGAQPPAKPTEATPNRLRRRRSRAGCCARSMAASHWSRDAAAIARSRSARLFQAPARSSRSRNAGDAGWWSPVRD